MFVQSSSSSLFPRYDERDRLSGDKAVLREKRELWLGWIGLGGSTHDDGSDEIKKFGEGSFGDEVSIVKKKPETHT